MFGFSHKLPLFAKDLAVAVKAYRPSKAAFSRQKDAFERALINNRVVEARSVASYETSASLNTAFPHYEAKIEVNCLPSLDATIRLLLELPPRLCRDVPLSFCSANLLPAVERVCGLVGS